MKVGIISVSPLALIVFLTVSTSAIGEYYRYTDEDGNINYTDDISRIPAAQRPDLQQYEEHQNNMPFVQKEEKGTTEEAQKQDIEQPVAVPLSEEKTVQEGSPENNQKASLDQRKKDLDNEFKTLSDERKQLEENKQSQKTRAEIKENNEKINTLNKRIDEFKKKQEAFNTEASTYNSQMAVEEEARKKAEKEKESVTSTTPAK